MKKSSRIPENFTYMQSNEPELQKFEKTRFMQLFQGKGRALSIQQLAVFEVLSRILFPEQQSDSSDEYHEERAASFRQLLRQHTEIIPIDLKKITAVEFRAILDEFHRVLSCGGSQANRKLIMQNMVGDYAIKRLLHRVRAYEESPNFYSEVAEGVGIKHQAINLRACGFPEKANICDKHLGRYLLLESVISGALEQLPEDEVIATITMKDGISKLFSKMKFSGNYDKQKLMAMREQIKPDKESGILGLLTLPPQFKELIPTDLPEISEHSHQRANDLIVNKFTSFKEFQSWQQCVAPIYIMYNHPHSINAGFELIVSEINKQSFGKTDPIYLAAWAHCEFQKIHLYGVANKRVGRVLMNLILARHGIAVQESSTPLEIHAYLVALFHPIFYSIVADSEKSQYNSMAFYEFLKNKITLSPAAWETYLQKQFLPSHERDVGLVTDILDILEDPTSESLLKLVSSIKSFVTQKPPTVVKEAVAEVKTEEAGVSFFKAKAKAKAKETELKITKHNLSLQKQVMPELEHLITQLGIGSMTKERWRIFNTSDEDCFMAQVDFTAEEDQKALQTHLAAKSAKIMVAKSKQQTYFARIYFRDKQELIALNSASKELN